MNAFGRWQVSSIELTEPLRELCCASGYTGVRVVLLWNGLALGHQRFAAEQLPLSPQQLAGCAALAIAPAAGDRILSEGFQSALPGLPEPDLQNPEAALQQLLAMDRPMDHLDDTIRPTGLTLTVAICTRERPGELARCLASLFALSEPPDEILVVDNAPESSDTLEVTARFPGVRYHLEPRKGLSAARNSALRVAKSDIVAFADDDVVVHPEWASRIRRSFDDPKTMLVTGLVLPGELETPAQLMFEEDFHFFHQGYRRRTFDSDFFNRSRGRSVPVWDIGAGANMAIRRDAYTRGYRFDTRLGPGVFGGCGEDSEYFYGLLAGGWSCVYEPSAFVYHFHRREMRDLRRHVRQYMQGHVAALLLQFWKYRHWGNLRRLFLELPTEYAILMLRLIVTGFTLDNRILLSGALGCLAGLRFAVTRKPVHTQEQ